MEVFYFIITAITSFLLGACPFALIIGKIFLHKDIRDYGDHNPGAANVFKAGSVPWGFLAVFLEIAKGVPFVLLALLYFGFSEPMVLFIGLCAVLGHAFSPFLRFKGGKATAVTFGVFLAIPEKEIVIVFVILMVAGFLLLDSDGWRIVLSTAGCLIFNVITGKSIWTWLFLLFVLVIITVKNIDALKTLPRSKPKIYIGFGQK
jgi:glycerol-3-phosphate acyltransferase PlsY